MARKNFTKQNIVKRFTEVGGHCEICGVKCKPGNYHGDHKNPDGLTGTNDKANLQILCLPCHAEKTNKVDKPAIAQAHRREWKHIGPAKSQKPKFKSAGFRQKERKHADRTPVERVSLYRREP